eukprot:COSAG01_NODE_5559_length_4185_cov_2.652227_4_plen_508_part_00
MRLSTQLPVLRQKRQRLLQRWCVVVLLLQCAQQPAAAAAQQPQQTITNGVVSLDLSPRGMTELRELKSPPGSDGPPLVLMLSNDDWAVAVHTGNSSRSGGGVMIGDEPWISNSREYTVDTATRKKSWDQQRTDDSVVLSTTTCSPKAPSTPPAPTKQAGGDGTSATLSWTCGWLADVEVVYTLELGAAFVTKTIRVRSATGGPAEFVVDKVTPWTNLQIVAEAARNDPPADFMLFRNGFNGGLAIAGFARFGELQRGVFVTVQNPFASYSNSPDGSHVAADCPAAGKGKNHYGSDLPESGGSGKHGLTIKECQDQCASITKCAGYVYLTAKCGKVPYPTCYFKSNAAATSTVPCSCLVSKPFSPLPNPAPPPPTPGRHPFGPVQGGVVIMATYEAGVMQSKDSINPDFHETDGAILGFTALGAYNFAGTSLNVGEYKAFTKCVETYLLDTASRTNSTVKVNVAWDENDYQIDAGTSEGRAEYKRIIDRNSELGEHHLCMSISLDSAF